MKVAFSNPVRQSLFEFADCLDGGKPKATAAYLSSCLSLVQLLAIGEGCFSLPDMLSHEICVNPSLFAAPCSLVQPEKWQAPVDGSILRANYPFT